jgi:ketosteroid isomerase-like protein
MPKESMTPDLVELTRLSLATLARREFGAYASPDIVLDTAGYGMGTFKGREAAIGFFKDRTSSFEDLKIEADEIIDLGHGVVLTVYHQEGRPLGASNYVRVRSPLVMLWEDGVIVRNTAYPEADIDEARAAAERLAEERGKAVSEEATTHDLLELMRADWGRGDYSSTEWAHPEIEFVIVDGPTPGRWSGLEGMAEGWRGVLSAWDEFHGVGSQYRELDDGRVLLLHSFGGRGKGSGFDISQTPIPAASILHVRDGKVTRFVIYFDRDRAFADLGLTAEGDTP